MQFSTVHAGICSSTPRWPPLYRFYLNDECWDRGAWCAVRRAPTAGWRVQLPLLNWITCGSKVTSHQQETGNPSERIKWTFWMRTCSVQRKLDYVFSSPVWLLGCVTHLPGWRKRSGTVPRSSLHPEPLVFFPHRPTNISAVWFNSSRKRNERGEGHGRAFYETPDESSCFRMWGFPLPLFKGSI